MSKIKTKELVVCVITFIILVLSVVTNVFAEDGSVFDSLGNNSNNIQQIEQRGNNTNNSSNSTNSTNNIVNRINNNTNRTTMPNTGVDYSILLIVAVCGVSAIYAYKKIRDYKNF